MTIQTSDCIIPESGQIAEGVTLGVRVFLTSEGIVLGPKARLDGTCVIGPDVTIGPGTWVRPGTVVIRSMPPNVIVEGHPAQVVGYLDMA